MSSTAGGHKLSTSALAKALDLPLNQLFATLKDYGWIRKVDDGWLLTAKGEFEGGEYIHSRRFGRYIVWPETITGHPLLVGMEANRRLTADALAKRFGLSVREFNRVLAERGLLRHGILGWRLTQRGEEAGGIELDSDHNGLPYILWPEAVLEEGAVAETLQYSQALPAGEGESGDLFVGSEEFVGLDGHRFDHRGRLMICHWLYLAGLPHACRRPVPGGPVADFYLPRQQLCIEYLGEEHCAGALGENLERLEGHRRRGWPVIEVRAEHLPNLDEYLTRSLLRYGVEVL